MEEIESGNGVRTEICHIKLDVNAGRLLVDIAREKAYDSGTYNDGIAYLFALGIDNYDICEKILKGELTLTVDTDEEGHQVYRTVADSWKPPETEEEVKKMYNEVREYCNTMRSSWTQITPPAWRRMLDQQEIALVECECTLLNELNELNPRKAHEMMVAMRGAVIEESNNRVRMQSDVEFNQESAARKKISEAAEDAKHVIAAHKERKAKAASRAKKHLDPCGDTECRFCLNGQCCFGGRTKQGCVQDTPELEEHLEAIMAIARIPDLASHGEVQRQAGKQFNFRFEGHEYTYTDSARDQAECPHCGARSIKGHMIDPIEDDEAGTFAFLGGKKLDEDQYVLCFECLTCFEHLFYHTHYKAIMMLLEEHPTLEAIIQGV